MIPPPIPENESERLENLESYNILDTLPEEDYDNITKIAAQICETPIALVSLVDSKRQWFKSRYGVDATETPKEYAFCAHAINKPLEPFIINDARIDERFHDNPLVVDQPNVIFYAGIPLTDGESSSVGTLCVIDHQPKSLSESQVETLKVLSKQVVNLLKLRKSNQTLSKTLEELKVKNEELEKFAYLAAHDLKSPLLNISNLAQIIKQDYKLDIDDAGLNMLELIIKSSEDLTSLVDGLLSYNTRDSILNKEKEVISLKEFESDLQDNIIKHYKEVNFTLNSSLSEIEVNKYGFNQIIRELVNNAIRYNDKNQVNIALNICETASHYRILVQDNGPGIHENYHEKIFNVFYKLNKYDKFGRTGNGIGLATVKNIIKKLQGEIHVNSILNKQTTFSVILKK